MRRRIQDAGLPLGIGLLVTIIFVASASAQTVYQKPPKKVLDVLHAPLPPDAFTNPTRDRMVLATPVRYPPIAYVAQPMLRLAGVRVNTRNRWPHDSPYWSGYTVVDIADGKQRPVALPEGAHLGIPRWSADGRQFAFLMQTDDVVRLWLGDATNATARGLPDLRINPILGSIVQWMPDQRTLLVKLVPSDQGPPPPEPAAPSGPNVQETDQGGAPSSTYEARDVLKNPHDADLFDYYATSQLAFVDTATGQVTMFGKPAIIGDVLPAPDGEHVLVERYHRPYSFQTTFERFPSEVDIWRRSNQKTVTVASLPLADHVPIWGVPEGPREFEWRPLPPSTSVQEPVMLVWAEALDGGDWNRSVPNRDRIMLLRAPFTTKPTEVLRLQQRFEGWWWSERTGLALIVEDDAIRHWTRTLAVNLDDPKTPPRIIFDHSSDERYKDPGYPVMRILPNGFWVLHQDADAIFLRGQGASPEGDRPFVDRFNLTTLTRERLFRSDRQAFESFQTWYNQGKGQFITRHESPSEPPNYFVRTLSERVADAASDEAEWRSTTRAITNFKDPTPELRGITKQIVRYKRADGLDLSFTLYLPPGYNAATRLPTVVWAYPLDFADPRMAGQVVGSTQRFTTLGWPLQLFFLLDGYAVLDNPSLPVVGDTNKIYDTYMEQLVAGARAALDKAVEMGVTDPERVGITGHSHGGLMTANLLAHTDLFRAGIARSGAYNRTLTAFGFQNERRTLWQARDVYVNVSPIFAADKINEPLLLIHGEADPNPGTVPLQSEKLFEAIRGTGGTARLVMLPYESHGYAAMESTEHALYEMMAWFERYVKKAPPRTPAPTSPPQGARAGSH